MKSTRIHQLIFTSLALTLYVSSYAIAAPSISSVSSATISHLQNITILGTLFGSKAPIEPQIWDTVDNQSAYSSLSDGSTIPSGGSNPYPTNYRGNVKYNTSDTQRGKSTAQYKASAIIGVLGDRAFSKGGNKIYISWWFKPETNFYGTNHSSKVLRLSNNADPVNKTFSWTQLEAYVYSNPSYGNVDGKWADYLFSSNAWNFCETLIDNTARTLKTYVNGVQASSHVWSAVAAFNFDQLNAIGFDGGGSSPPSITFWMDDIYADNTFARVMICDSSTWTTKTHCEMQIPNTTWTDGQIQIIVNQGGFASGSTAYLYVVDDSNNVSPGKQITFSSSSSAPTTPADATPPTVSIVSPVTGSTINGNISISASASDNIGVSKVEFYLDAASTPLATVTSSPYTFTFNSSSVANGTHTFSAKAYDATNNFGQSATVSVTVNNVTSVPSTTVTRNECVTPPSGTIFCEDFEGTNPKANFSDYDGNPDTENLIVLDSGPAANSSNKAIRLRVPAGKSGGSDLLKVLPVTSDKLYARWFFKYEPGFNFTARNHGAGLTAGSRSYLGQSGIRPTGADWAGFQVQYQENTAYPYSYTYYRGMYQDCINPNGSCWGDSFPCVYDNGVTYCTKSQDRPTVTLPTLVAGKWYCYEQMVDMGISSSTGVGATGRITQWLDNNQIGDNTNLWIRTTSTLKLENLWLLLYHHDGTHSVVGELIDNVVVSTQRIGCGGPLPVIAPTGVRIKQVVP